MSFRHKKGKFLPYKILGKLAVYGKRPDNTETESMSVPRDMFKRMMCHVWLCGYEAQRVTLVQITHYTSPNYTDHPK